MADVAKLKVDFDATGHGKVMLDGVDISHCVNAVAFKGQAGSLTEVSLTIHADVDATVEAKLDQVALKKLRPEVKTVRALDGREIPVRSRPPV